MAFGTFLARRETTIGIPYVVTLTVRYRKCICRYYMLMQQSKSNSKNIKIRASPKWQIHHKARYIFLLYPLGGETLMMIYTSKSSIIAINTTAMYSTLHSTADVL